MAIRKHEARINLVSLAYDGGIIAPGTELLFSKAIGGAAPVVMFLDGEEIKEVALPSRYVKHMEPVQHETPTLETLREHLFIRDNQLYPLVDRHYHTGEIVEVKHRIALDSKSCLVKGQRLQVIKGGPTPTLAYFHPLEYIEEQVTWPHEPINRGLAVVPDADVELNPAGIARLSVTVKSYGDDNDPSAPFIASIGADGFDVRVLRRDNNDEMSIAPGDELKASRLAALVRDNWGVTGGRQLSRHRDTVSDQEIMRGLVEYHQSTARNLMSFAQYLRQKELIAWRQAAIDKRLRQSA